MQKNKDGKLIFSPSDLTRYFESEFTSWMDRYQKFHLKEGPLEGVHRNPPDPLNELLADKGNKHEATVLAALNKQSKSVEISRDGSQETRIAATLQTMKDGAQIIYQAALSGDHLFGYADFLEKRSGKSKLGDHYYVPLDSKISSVPKPTAILQLCAYADMLETTQGRLPDEIFVVTKDEQRHQFKTESFYYFYQYFKQRFLNYHNIFKIADQPLPLGKADHRDWSIYARKVLHQRDDIALTARIRQSQIEYLNLVGLTTLSGLAKSAKKKIKGLSDDHLANLTNQARLQVASKDKRPPLYEVRPHPEDKRIGLAMLPDSHPKDVFFDMEGYPLLGSNGLEYLYGVAERGKNYIEFWAHHPDEEMKAFCKFVAWAHKRWQQNPGMHIYHFAPYEPSTLKRLMGTYGQCEAMIGDLLKAEVFVDLYAVVVQGLRVGTYSYGLKAIEALYYPERKTEVSSGAESAVEFARWLDTGDHKNPETCPFLDRIRKYNQDDCWSTHDLEAFLQKVKKDEGISYLPMAKEEYKEDDGSTKAVNTQFAEALLTQVPADQRGLPLESAKPENYVCELLSHCLEFHRREDRPSWWLYYARRDMTRDQLARDPDALVGVKIKKDAEGLLHCSFDPEQDTKYRVGTEVLILENEQPFERLEIVEWDILASTVVLKGKPKGIPESEFTLAPASDQIRCGSQH